MTIENPYQPPSFGVTHAAVERTAAGAPSASEVEAAADDGEKEAPKALNKAARKPANKAAAK